MKTYLTFGILVLYALLGVNVVNLSAEENWTRKADMPTQRYNFDTCIVNGKIFASGGEVDKFGDISIATVEMYDPKTDTWERKADMPTARSGVSTSVVDGKIYAIGGAEVNKTKEILYRRVFDEIHTTFFSPLSNIYLLTLPRLKSWDSCFFIIALDGGEPVQLTDPTFWHFTGDWFDPAYALSVSPQPQLLTIQWGDLKKRNP